MQILNFLDDHSRMLLACVAYPRVTGPAIVAVFRETTALHGVPACVLSDNGMVLTTRFAGGKGGKNGLETELHRLGVTQKNSSPNHPQTCDKVERLHQTLKNGSPPSRTSPPPSPSSKPCWTPSATSTTTAARTAPLNRRTPAAAYATRAKATPAGTRTHTHDRVHRDKIDDSGVVTLRHHGRLHHIGIRRAHARTHVIMLVQDLHIRVIAAATGELLHETGPRPDQEPPASRRPTKAEQAEPVGPTCRRCLATSQWSG